jgi:acyl-coenzyme A synthetase/AMP-(fatty) acid ligase
MVPEAIEFRDELPKTSTGKVDRTALLTQKQGGQKAAVEAVAAPVSV